jgi:SAM-dependent methyltransferase
VWGEFGSIVACSEWIGGREVNGPGRSARRRCAAHCGDVKDAHEGSSKTMNTEALAESPIGRIFVGLMAAIMESRLRYKLFGPGKILAGAGVRPGTRILEVGCGTGFFTLAAARMVGEQGSLIAMDMLQASVDLVEKRVQAAGLSNVEVIQGDALDTKLESASCDQALIFGIIPAPMLPMEKLLAEMHRILRPGGMLAVWPPSWVHNPIVKSERFRYINMRSGVSNYQKIDEA